MDIFTDEGMNNRFLTVDCRNKNHNFDSIEVIVFYISSFCYFELRVEILAELLVGKVSCQKPFISTTFFPVHAEHSYIEASITIQVCCFDYIRCC